MFNKKSKKSSQVPWKTALVGNPTNVVIGPLGFQGELDAKPKGEKCNSPRRPNLTANLGKKSPKPLRIVSNERESKAQEPPTIRASTVAVGIGDSEPRDPLSGYSRSLLPRLVLMLIFFAIAR